LKKPRLTLKEIANFIDLNFNYDLLSSKNSEIPTGLAHDVYTREKWYPLRPNVNEKYLKEIPKWAVRIIENKCGRLANNFKYTPQGP
jgi:hypothetical protein